jgi:hypothetical protein
MPAPTATNTRIRRRVPIDAPEQQIQGDADGHEGRGHGDVCNQRETEQGRISGQVLDGRGRVTRDSDPETDTQVRQAAEDEHEQVEGAGGSSESCGGGHGCSRVRMDSEVTMTQERSAAIGLRARSG